MIEKRGTLRLPVNGEDIAVPSAAHLSCPKCGEVVLDSRTRSGSERTRSRFTGRSTASCRPTKSGDPRAVQPQSSGLGALASTGRQHSLPLGVGQERADRAMECLLRLIRDLPGSIDYLRDHAA